MSLSHFDPLANLRVFEDAFTRMLSEPQGNRPVGARGRHLSRPKTNSCSRPICRTWI